MTGEKIRIAREAARDFVYEVDLSKSRVGLVGFDTSSRLHIGLSQDEARIQRAIEQLQARGGTHIDLGLAEARREMARNGRPDLARPIFVLLSDGGNNAGPAPVMVEAEAAKRVGIEIYTIGIQSDDALMTAVASSPEHFFSPLSARFLYDAFDAIAQRITTATLFRRLVVTDRIPANMRYVDGSADPPAAFDPAGHTLTWTLENVPFRGFGLGYTLQPLAVGTWPTNVVAWGEGEDGYGRPGRVDFPVPEVIVIGPTATPPPPSPSPTATPTDRPTPTPTRLPGPIYLPILLREACEPTRLRADVVLVLDASSSMEGEKLAAAKAAAGRFVDLLLPPARGDLPAARNQVAVVGFHAEAWLAAGLTADAALLHAAIDGLEMVEGTRIDHGLDVALDALWGPRHRPEHTPAIVLLTDGLQNGPVEPVYALAEEARGRGTLLYTIGLGEDVDADFLARLAGSPSRRYLAPGPADLAAIYDQIAGQIPCPADAYWGRRVRP
jgi:Mg-chelatase subunit ChlD